MSQSALSLLLGDQLVNDLYGIRQNTVGSQKGGITDRMPQWYDGSGNYDATSGAVTAENIAYQNALNNGTNPLPAYLIEGQGNIGYLTMSMSAAGSNYTAADAQATTQGAAWAQARQTDSTGAYVGSGDQDHSTDVWLCKELPAVIACRDVGGAQAALVAPYTAGLIAATRWMTSEPDQTTALASIQPFSHRFAMHGGNWLMASNLAGGDTGMTGFAAEYLTTYCGEILSGGWTCHAVNPGPRTNSSGTLLNVSGVLVAPGATAPTLPSGYSYSGVVFSADGVLPERDDYNAEASEWNSIQTRGCDINYQLDGLMYACFALTQMPPSSLRTQLLATVLTGGKWCLTRLNLDGTANTVGACRMGIGFNTDGSLKSEDYNGNLRSLEALYYLTGYLPFYNAALRMGASIFPNIVNYTGLSNDSNGNITTTGTDYYGLAATRYSQLQASLPSNSVVISPTLTSSVTSKYRKPAWNLQAIDAKGNTLLDLSSYVKSFNLSFTDEIRANDATIVLDNSKGEFDVYGAGTYSSILQINTLLVLKKGFEDAATGTSTLYPAFVGRITNIDFDYSRSNVQEVTIRLLDLFGLSTQHKFTTIPYYSSEINLIAQNLINHYGDPATSLFGFNLYPLNKLTSIPNGFPSMTLIECVTDLYNLCIYNAYYGYDGKFTTFPKLGTQASGSPGILGYPDQQTAPNPDFIFSDASLIESINEEGQTMNFNNCVKVLGQDLSTSVTLGPSQILATYGTRSQPEYLARGATTGAVTISFTSQVGNNNKLSASNVYLEIHDPSFEFDGPNGNDYKYIAIVPGLYNENGQLIDTYMQGCNDYVTNPNGGDPIPASQGPAFPVSQVGNSDYPSSFQKVISRKQDGTEEGVIWIASPNSYKTTYTSSITEVVIHAVANSDGGGYFFSINVWGQPNVNTQNVLTSIVDYNSQSITENVLDLFGDHMTYSGSKIPWAMGTIVEVAVAPGTKPSTDLTAPVVIGTTVLPVNSSNNFAIASGVIAGTNTVNTVAIGRNNATANPTTLLANVQAGASNITVTNPSGYFAGNTFTIADSSSESGVIELVTGNTITLANPLQYSHTSGSVVYAPTYREYATVAAATNSTTITLTSGLNYAHGAGSVVQGITAALSADNTYQSLYVHADWEAGQLIFDDLVYRPFSADQLYDVGHADSTSVVFNTQFCKDPAPQSVYQTNRYIDYGSQFVYTLSGLTPGLGYTVRLHFADPTSTKDTARVFAIIINEVYVETSLDIFGTVGGNSTPGSTEPLALVKEYTGCTANNNGNITILFGNGSNLSLSNKGNGEPICSGIEVLPPEGSGASAYTINCGGPAIGPSTSTTLNGATSVGTDVITVASSAGMTAGSQVQIDDNYVPTNTASETATIQSISGNTITFTSNLGYAHSSGANVYPLPIVQVTYGWSPTQQTYGLQSEEINDPLISTLADAEALATYAVNRSAWQRNGITIVTLSIPTIKPGQCIKFWNSRISKFMYMYVASIQRNMSRSSKQNVDRDTYSGYLLFVGAN